MSFLEKLVRKSKEVDKVDLVSKTFRSIAMIFFLVMLIPYTIRLEYGIVKITNVKDVVIITSLGISMIVFAIFWLVAVIASYYSIFLKEVKKNESKIMENKSIEPVLKKFQNLLFWSIFRMLLTAFLLVAGTYFIYYAYNSVI